MTSADPAPGAGAPAQPQAALILDLATLTDADLTEVTDLSRQLRLRGALLAAGGPEASDHGDAVRPLVDAWHRDARWPGPRALLALGRVVLADGRRIDLARSWLATRTPTPALRQACGTAGLAGIVVVADGPAPADDPTGPVVRHAARLADVTLSMVPRAGGCWHG